MNKIQNLFKEEVPDELKKTLDLCLHSSRLKILDEDKLCKSLQILDEQIMIECSFDDLPSHESTNYISELPFHLVRSEEITLFFNSQTLQKSKQQADFLEKLQSYIPNVEINYEITNLYSDVKCDVILFLHGYHHLPTSFLDTIEYILDGKNQLGFSYLDITETVRGEKEPQRLFLSLDQLVETPLYHPVKNKLSLAQRIIIIFESTTGEIGEKYKQFLDYVYSVADNDAAIIFDVKEVERLDEEPIVILLGGVDDSDKLSMDCGEIFTKFCTANSDFCLHEFSKMRLDVSNKLHKKIEPIRLQDNLSKAPNCVAVYYGYEEIKVFEFNSDDKKCFANFLEKVKLFLSEFYQSPN